MEWVPDLRNEKCNFQDADLPFLVDQQLKDIAVSTPLTIIADDFQLAKNCDRRDEA
jgi:hypothetical protein